MLAEEEASDFEAMAKQSWQSFSTMKRFVSEAQRLENASWRLWFMQRHREPEPKRRESRSDENETEDEDDDDAEDDDRERVPCVYCELHTASLSCHGCCHDAYCVSCFKLVHKKGHLATHTAAKIQTQSHSAAARDDGARDSPVLSPRSPPTVSPDASRHHKDRSTRGKAKSWEIQMDILLQRLMANSLHSENDISVHNIDSRRSLGAADAALLDFGAAFHGDSDDELDATTDTRREEDPADHWSTDSRSSLGSSIDIAATGPARVKSADLGVLEETAMHKQLSVDVASMRGESSASPTATVTPSSAASSVVAASPVLEPMPDNLESLDGLSSSLFPSTLAKSKSRKKNSICANCNGNHITIDCPLLENSLGGNGTSHGAHAGGVDTVLRKCFTTIHNDNLSNSTHAFLGDEVSVRGAGNFKNHFAPAKSISAGGAWSSFGMNSISEDQTADMEDSLPILGGLHEVGDEARHWDSATWMVSSLATELPLDVYGTLRRVEKQGHTSPLDIDGAPSMAGWVHVKKPGSKWCKRFVCLYRNNFWEYLDDKENSRPIGYANLAEGSVHAHQNTLIEFALRYFRYSSPESPRDECWIQCESDEDASLWRDALTIATKLQAEDLFDMRPDSHLSSSDAGYELGKGRFATVRRARRRRAGQKHENQNDCCALKIIDKQVFWDLVAHETERDDTVIREILTQTVLTVRAGSSYCPVIRLLSLFETRSLLVLELELMREGDLHEEIVTKSAVNESTASFLVASLVHAIHFCQENGVAHRDVKLSNLALDVSASPKGRSLSVIKLADFGMAAFVQADGTLKGRCGTPGFVAPEILTAGKGESYPAGVDMFSVGVVTYTMLCGYEPFFGVNDEELIQMNKAVEFEFEEPEWSSISDEAKDLISLMMEKDTQRRITPLEALQHPFLIDASRELDEAIRSSPATEVSTLRLF